MDKREIIESVMNSMDSDATFIANSLIKFKLSKEINVAYSDAIRTGKNTEELLDNAYNEIKSDWSNRTKQSADIMRNFAYLLNEVASLLETSSPEVINKKVVCSGSMNSFSTQIKDDDDICNLF